MKKKKFKEILKRKIRWAEKVEKDYENDPRMRMFASDAKTICNAILENLKEI